MDTIYISNSDIKLYGNTIFSITNRLGVGLTQTYSNTTSILPFSDRSAYNSLCEQNLGGSSKNYMILLDKFLQTNLPIPTIRTILPKTISDITNFGTGPIFVKRRRTGFVLDTTDSQFRKEKNGISYTKWDSPAAFVAQLSSPAFSGFWDNQNNPNDAFLGEYIIQDYVDMMTQTLDICCSVNSTGQLYVYFYGTKTLDATDNHQLGGCSQKAPDAVLTALTNQLQNVILSLGVKNTWFSCEFAWYNNEWCLYDLNFRPIASFICSMRDYPSLDNAINFAMDKPISNTIIYIETRSYRSSNLGMDKLSMVNSCNVYPRFDEANVITRVTSAGFTEEEMLSKFTKLDSLI